MRQADSALGLTPTTTAKVTAAPAPQVEPATVRA
jgi:hypothetical protein